MKTHELRKNKEYALQLTIFVNTVLISLNPSFSFKKVSEATTTIRNWEPEGELLHNYT